MKTDKIKISYEKPKIKLVHIYDESDTCSGTNMISEKIGAANQDDAFSEYEKIDKNDYLHS